MRWLLYLIFGRCNHWYTPNHCDDWVQCQKRKGHDDDMHQSSHHRWRTGSHWELIEDFVKEL